MNTSLLSRLQLGLSHLHTTISGILVTVFGVAALIANSPESLNLDVFGPEAKRKVVIWCTTLASIAYLYKAVMTPQIGGPNQILPPAKAAIAKAALVLFSGVLLLGAAYFGGNLLAYAIWIQLR